MLRSRTCPSVTRRAATLKNSESQLSFSGVVNGARVVVLDEWERATPTCGELRRQVVEARFGSSLVAPGKRLMRSVAEL